MKRLVRRIACYPFLALGSTLLWGAVELLALQRAHRRGQKPASTNVTLGDQAMQHLGRQ